MKKIFIIIFGVIFAVSVIARGEYGMEQYNNKKNLDAVRQIAKINGTCEVAVLSHRKTVLAGVQLDGGINSDDIYISTQKILSAAFPKARKIILEVDSQKANDILELSYYIESDIKRNILIKRFNYLVRAE